MIRTAIIALTVPALLTLGCTGELTPADGDEGGGPDAMQTPEETVYRQNVEPLFTATRPKGLCVTCHIGESSLGGPVLGSDPESIYSSLLSGTYLADPPENSLLITHGDHEGNAFCTGPDTPYAGCTEDEVSAITGWIQLEIDAGNL